LSSYTHGEKNDHDNNDKDEEETRHTTPSTALVLVCRRELLGRRLRVVRDIDDVALDVVWCG
jgi:hypothetical protein